MIDELLAEFRNPLNFENDFDVFDSVASYDAGIGIIESVHRYLKKENDLRFHEYGINSQLLK